MNRIVRVAIITLCIVGAGVSPAFAGLGLQAGASINPDDFIVGVHFKTRPLAENLDFIPSVEAGFGDATMIAGNADLHYNFTTSSKLLPYLGGGLTLNWFDFDEGSQTDFGGSILGGIQLSKKIYLETKVGLGDVPDWKFLLGWNR
jgi:opacity protein-like surface antigen